MNVKDLETRVSDYHIFKFTLVIAAYCTRALINLSHLCCFEKKDKKCRPHLKGQPSSPRQTREKRSVNQYVLKK